MNLTIKSKQKSNEAKTETYFTEDRCESCWCHIAYNIRMNRQDNKVTLFAILRAGGESLNSNVNIQ